jgi:hypothetical protein
MQIQGMHTIIRDAKTPKNDFTFFADRLNRLVSDAEVCVSPLAPIHNQNPSHSFNWFLRLHFGHTKTHRPRSVAAL